MLSYTGTIKLFSGPFIPRNWLACNGQLLPISQYAELYSLIQTVYGGDGKKTFALPDLRGMVPMGMGHGFGLTNRTMGEKVGQESQALNLANLPSHTHETQNNPSKNEHILFSQNDAVNETPQEGDVLAVAQLQAGIGNQKVKSFGPPTNLVNGQELDVVDSINLTINQTGNNEPHNNIQPYLAMQYIICWSGIYPQRH